jgi:hypothetical protein
MTLRHITSAIKDHNPDVGERRAVPRLGEARLAPTTDMFICSRNNISHQFPLTLCLKDSTESFCGNLETSYFLHSCVNS